MRNLLALSVAALALAGCSVSVGAGDPGSPEVVVSEATPTSFSVEERALAIEFVHSEVSTFCFSDCRPTLSWIEMAEMSGPFDPDDFLDYAVRMEAFPRGDLSAACRVFWLGEDTDIRTAAMERGEDPNAWVAAFYATCDS